MTFNARTFSKALKREIVDAFPTAATFRKRHVPGVGYTYFIKNAEGKTLCKVFRENGRMVSL